MHPVEQKDEALLKDCDLLRTRRGGPGGQRRNKVQTAVVLTHRPTGIRVEANERRSPRENQAIALRRLRIELALRLRQPRERVSDLWASRGRGGRMAVNPAHEDFPSLLAEALDALAQQGHDTTAAARLLGISHSQLIKFLKLEPRALRQVNQWRQAAGLHPLK